MAAARPLPTLFKLTVLQRECNHARTSDPFVVSTPAAERSSAPSHRVTTRAIASDCSFPIAGLSVLPVVCIPLSDYKFMANVDASFVFAECSDHGREAPFPCKKSEPIRNCEPGRGTKCGTG